MKPYFSIALTALAMATAAPAFSQENSIIGSWRMMSLQFANADGTMAEVPYTGQVIFTEGGTLFVQAMNPDPEAAHTPYMLSGYEANYGPVVINEANKTFTIAVAGARSHRPGTRARVRGCRRRTGDQASRLCRRVARHLRTLLSGALPSHRAFRSGQLASGPCVPTA